MMIKVNLIDKAKNVLTTNDMGGYTIPTQGLYPFQWNWDAAITALGWMKISESRAWQEIELLLKGQWENGMVPHIIFHQEVESYFPGSDVWGSQGEPKSTSISQPPVLASVVKMMVEQAKDKALAQQKIDEFLPKLIAYHEWWYRERSRDNKGLVVSYHPWESGMDNSPAWDKSLAAVPPIDWSYQRKDLELVDVEERPHQAEYDRYLYLVDFYKNANFDSDKIYQDCPYKVLDIGIISILHKATQDLIVLCQQNQLQEEKTAFLAEQLTLTEANISELWDDEQQSFLNKDMLTGELSPVLTSGCLLALYAGFADKPQVLAIKSLLKDWLAITHYGVSSTYARCAEFEAQRYWRGPVWLHINWLVALGAQEHGFIEESDMIKASSKCLIEESGFFEYFNCQTGKGCGGDTFSWTAAIALHWLL